MSKDIHIKKGLDIKLKGEAEKFTENAITSDVYTLIPEDFHSIIPKLSVKVGAQLKAGEAVFYNKANEEMIFPSPTETKMDKGAFIVNLRFIIHSQISNAAVFLPSAVKGLYPVLRQYQLNSFDAWIVRSKASSYDPSTRYTVAP